jgi:hypothetical protein
MCHHLLLIIHAIILIHLIYPWPQTIILYFLQTSSTQRPSSSIFLLCTCASLDHIIFILAIILRPFFWIIVVIVSVTSTRILEMVWSRNHIRVYWFPARLWGFGSFTLYWHLLYFILEFVEVIRIAALMMGFHSNLHALFIFNRIISENLFIQQHIVELTVILQDCIVAALLL